MTLRRLCLFGCVLFALAVSQPAGSTTAPCVTCQAKVGPPGPPGPPGSPGPKGEPGTCEGQCPRVLRESFHVDFELPVPFDAARDLFLSVDQGPGKRFDRVYYLKASDTLIYLDLNHAAGPRAIGFRRGGELQIPWDRIEPAGPRMLAFLVVNPANGRPHECDLNLDVLIANAQARGVAIGWVPLAQFVTFGAFPALPPDLFEGVP